MKFENAFGAQLTKRECEKTIATLRGAFVWSKSKQGFRYWDEVETNLLRVISEADLYLASKTGDDHVSARS